MTRPSRPIEQPRFVLQRGPAAPVEPCTCGSPFAVLRVTAGQLLLSCTACAATLDPTIVLFHELDPARRSPGHEGCPRRRVVVPRVREEVAASAVTKHGAERFDLFCPDCGNKDGAVGKAELSGGAFTKPRDNNAFQRTDVLERAKWRCELCCVHGVGLHVGHCLSLKDAQRMNVARDIHESLWNKCALCDDCNLANRGGYGEQSMSPSTYCGLSHTREEARRMLDFGTKGPEPVNPDFYRIYCLLRQRFTERRKEAA